MVRLRMRVIGLGESFMRKTVFWILLFWKIWGQPLMACGHPYKSQSKAKTCLLGISTFVIRSRTQSYSPDQEKLTDKVNLMGI